jgi:glutamyl-tRNA synthetase
MEAIRTRFAPSPTGHLHIGGARTALFNWLYSRHHGGKFILRIEDTDQQRSTEESTNAILDAMTWLGLTWDEGPYFQAKRVQIHRDMVLRLVNSGKAYYCACQPEELEEKRKRALAEGRKPKYDGTCRDKGLPRTDSTVVRFRCPDTGATVFDDLIKGRIAFSNEELDDLVIERADGYPTYNFAVVVDDAQMAITHVIRGDDHVNNTPRQILLYQALGFAVPRFGHVPMILGSDKARLSKRHGATSVMAYRDMGYLPEALVNYLVRLGWSHGDQEIFSLAEMIELFDLDAVGKSAAVFNPDKLLWLNQHYIGEYPLARLAQVMPTFFTRLGISVQDDDFLRKVVTDLRPRAKTLVEMAESGRFYFESEVTYDAEAAARFLTVPNIELLESIDRHLQSADFTKGGIERLLRSIAEDRKAKIKDIAQPLRVALTGKTVSPGLDEVMVSLGRNNTSQRIRDAIKYIRSTAPPGSVQNPGK